MSLMYHYSICFYESGKYEIIKSKLLIIKLTNNPPTSCFSLVGSCRNITYYELSAQDPSRYKSTIILCYFYTFPCQQIYTKLLAEITLFI